VLGTPANMPLAPQHSRLHRLGCDAIVELEPSTNAWPHVQTSIFRPSLSRNDPVRIRIMSINHQIPRPPIVKS
jgi:hypothetical protein